MAKLNWAAADKKKIAELYGRSETFYDRWRAGNFVVVLFNIFLLPRSDMGRWWKKLLRSSSI